MKNQEGIKKLLITCPGLINLSEKDCLVLGGLIEDYGKQEFMRGENKANDERKAAKRNNADETAYPTLFYDEYTGTPNGHNSGLTKREYAAIKAMQGYICLLKDSPAYSIDSIDEIVTDSIIIADKLFAELEKPIQKIK